MRFGAGAVTEGRQRKAGLNREPRPPFWARSTAPQRGAGSRQDGRQPTGARRARPATSRMQSDENRKRFPHAGSGAVPGWRWQRAGSGGADRRVLPPPGAAVRAEGSGPPTAVLPLPPSPLEEGKGLLRLRDGGTRRRGEGTVAPPLRLKVGAPPSSEEAASARRGPNARGHAGGTGVTGAGPLSGGVS